MSLKVGTDNTAYSCNSWGFSRAGLISIPDESHEAISKGIKGCFGEDYLFGLESGAFPEQVTRNFPGQTPWG
jgi:hypothetical protein